MKEKIKKLQEELDKVYDELYELKSIKDKSYLFNSHYELINDLEHGINNKLTEYKRKQYTEDEPTLEDFIDVLNNLKRYILEYKKSYNL